MSPECMGTHGGRQVLEAVQSVQLGQREQDRTKVKLCGGPMVCPQEPRRLMAGSGRKPLTTRRDPFAPVQRHPPL